MSRNLVNLYLCNFKRDYNRSPWCDKQGGPCFCTTDKNFALLQSDGKPIVIDQVPEHNELTKEEDRQA